MTYPAADPNALRGLESRVNAAVSSVRSQLEDLARDVEDLQTKVGDTDDLDYTLRSLKDSIEDLEATAERLESELDDHTSDTERALKKLTARVRLLENLAQPAEGAPTADLDTIDAAWKELAAAAQRGAEAAAGLLTDAARQVHQGAINRHRETEQRRRDAQQRAIAAAKTLATATHTERAHKKAASDFTTALTAEDSARANLGALAAEANTARLALQADDRRRREAAPAIADGKKASRKLALTLRTRLARVLADRAVLPVWFVTVLGPAPPADATQEWLDLAVDVLVYRITHQITDPVVALGRAHHDAAGAAQHRDLTQALRAWNS
ncbi:hypothetical protein GCM10023347_07430 [Streptomyces chumphonensis]|uniref:Uncharacterized protein n=1 Tax=Streptomyces chumphonensis TaxID=1214925 RepID=A0A927F3H0_9ACTN|nr:hypothetical protein [Streptomyces chumphonensis]MBD3934863.1 hypothetical protein [Streptomyces chumphonensis]